MDKALPLLKQTMEMTKAKLGLDHPDTLRRMNNLAMAYLAAKELDKALPLLEQTLERSKIKPGPHHPTTLFSMHNLALTYRDAEKLDKAISLFEETVRERKTVLGPTNPDTLISMNGLARSYFAKGRYTDALPLFLQTAEMWEKLNRADAGGLYDAACVRAVTAAVLEKAKTPGEETTRLANEQGDLAMAWLERAVAAGFNDVAHMKLNKDLNVLRGRDDFKKLMLDLEAKKKSGASLK
jgi:tetratricopeptide (TPR) repeat protein